jgi:phosphopantothenoylcysteine synthetase/decarboxylase
VLFPNMNEVMWRNRALQRNVAQVREDGHIVVEPELRPAVELASGEVRENRVLHQPEEAVEILRKLLHGRRQGTEAAS